jgi:hypothetical protein
MDLSVGGVGWRKPDRMIQLAAIILGIVIVRRATYLRRDRILTLGEFVVTSVLNFT